MKGGGGKKKTNQQGRQHTHLAEESNQQNKEKQKQDNFEWAMLVPRNRFDKSCFFLCFHKVSHLMKNWPLH